MTEVKIDVEFQEPQAVCGSHGRQRHRSFQRQTSMKRQDSWTDFKDKAFQMACTVILPKHRRVSPANFAGGSMKSCAPSISVKSLPQIRTFDDADKLRKNFERSISAQEPSARAHGPIPDIPTGQVQRTRRKVLFVPEEPCIDEEKERSLSESSSAPSLLEIETADREFEKGFSRSRKSRHAPVPKFLVRQTSTLTVEDDESPQTRLDPFFKVRGEPFDEDSRLLEVKEAARLEDEGEATEKSMVFEEDDEDHLLYSDYYSCMPPPIFMLCITMIEVGFFIYHAKLLINNPKYGYIGKYSPAPIDSTLIYSPARRYELWRWMTYALVHSGYMHLINNVAIQLVLGILLEMVHKFWRVLAIYVAGILAGSLATSIAEPFNYLAGASAGVYALITAHLSTGVDFMASTFTLELPNGCQLGMNWTEMEHPWIRVLIFVAFLIHDGGTAIYFSYIIGEKTNVGYAAHLGGAMAGLLVGSLALKNLRWEQWEKILWYTCIVICAVLLIFAIVWNIVRTDLFP